jgi:predicted CoA-binding protein
MKNKQTLVIGASLKPDRYSNVAINMLREYNIPTKAIGLREGKVADVEIEVGLPYYDDVDTVTLYINATRQEAYYEYIVSLNPSRIIFNPGTENDMFYRILDRYAIEYEVACTLTLLRTNQY